MDSGRKDGGRQSVAVVGSGISGLSAAWLLNNAHDVTLFEGADRLGGHSNTVMVPDGDQDIPVDTGFIVYNPLNYPNLVPFFEALDVPTIASDMSFSASIGPGKFEYAGGDFKGLLGQPSNIVRPRFWRMVWDILRFYREADGVLTAGGATGRTLGEVLDAGGYSKSFVYDHLLPMGAAIWSTPLTDMLDHPAESFIRFFNNHGLLRLRDRPQWRTVQGGSKVYVDKVAAILGEDRISLGDPVVKVIRDGADANGAEIVLKSGARKRFDQVVLACHSDEALGMLDTPSEQERQLLSAIPYQQNRAVLHFDTNLMPRRRAVWSSWNYLSEASETNGDAAGEPQVCLTYWMNMLQSIKSDKPVLVTLNPIVEPDPAKVVKEISYSHPLFDREALKAQQQLWSIQGQGSVWYCGAWFGSGFHEDGIQAGLAVAEAIGGERRPWDVPHESGRIFLPNTPVLSPKGQEGQEAKAA